MRKFLFLLVVLAATLHAGPDTLTTKLNAIKTRYNLAGMSVAVSDGERVLYARGFGQRDINRGLPMTDSTLYRIASISKMFTATALMVLYDQGWINLDQDISNYLGFTLRNPYFPSQVITLRHILSHTAGLRDGTGYDGFLGASTSGGNVPHIQALLLQGGSYYTSDMWSSSYGPASKYFYYANINYGIIGTVIERVSGIRFDRFCMDNIFAPLGLKGSFNLQDLTDFNQLAVLYRRSGGNWVPQADNYGGIKPPAPNFSTYVIGTNGVLFGPQGNVRTSARDLATFARMHMNRGIVNGVRILSETAADLMQQLNWSYNGSNGNNYYGIFNTYAIGCHATTDLLPGETLTGHPGEAYGLISDLYFSKIKRYSISFITNGGEWGNGTYSGWYNVEEEVYKACKEELPRISAITAQETTIHRGTGLLAWPNPNYGAVTFSFAATGAGTSVVQVFDMTGRKVHEGKVVTSGREAVTVPVSFSAVPQGIYTAVVIQPDGKSSTVKLVRLSRD